ncbi:MAG TPA: hypothetical protein VF868_11275 [Bacteroidia bacterium]|jgi:hypothetical protein
MKKLIIAAVILVSMSVKAFAGPIITIKVRIGQKSLSCAGFGWCGGSVGVESAFSNGTIQFNERSNELMWEISNESMKGKESLIRDGKVKIGEDAEIEADILKALRTTRQLVIKAGMYDIEKTSFGYKLIIKQ